ncbi:glycoside hydrolase family 18 protein [Xylariaceae sp. FL0255]|nr:glycoside hydrolase family 18 protein [Xylariaceae sp. FL0255]
MARFGLISLAISTLLCGVVNATFNILSKNNVAVYYGQGPNQKRLTTFCADPTIDIIILSFVDLFPQQANGYPGINFGNQCWGTTYNAPGKNVSQDALYMCPQLAQDLYTCRQSYSTKFLLSLGGASTEYQLTGASNGTLFANQLWKLFGPANQTWINNGNPRPFDYTNATTGVTSRFSVDGFDLDIEHPSTDGSAGYVALVQQLRANFATDKSQQFYLTASPQCVVPDANLATTLKAVQFDMLFVQFYNTPQCSARNWVNSNPNYVPGGATNSSGFTFTSWVSFLAATTYSKTAPILITLPGSNAAASAGAYITVAQTQQLANAYYCNARFGGIGVWDATYAQQSIANGGKFFYQNAKATLNTASTDTRLSCNKK